MRKYITPLLLTAMFGLAFVNTRHEVNEIHPDSWCRAQGKSVVVYYRPVNGECNPERLSHYPKIGERKG